MPWELDLLCVVSSYLYTAFDIYKTPGERKYGRQVAKSWSCQQKASSVHTISKHVLSFLARPSRPAIVSVVRPE
jgi:hypothetical protein